MHLIKNKLVINISTRILLMSNRLKNENVVTLASADHIDHIAAYIAWRDNGGNIFIKSPKMPLIQSLNVDQQVASFKGKNSLLVHTSGTTGEPKIVCHTIKQLQAASNISRQAMEWDRTSKYLNFLPAFTIGFWTVAMSAIVDSGMTTVFGSPETLRSDIQEDVNIAFMVPSMIDMLRVRCPSIDFSKFTRISTGSALLTNRHTEFLFNNGVQSVSHLYGTTEICAPVLHRETTSAEDYSTYLTLPTYSCNAYKFVNGELYVKGETVCENYTDFRSEDGWFKTGDLWEVNSNLIKFVGRNNDIIKVNGCKCSLLQIESVFEDMANFGQVQAILRTKLGIEWIELLYTNKTVKINKQELYQRIKDVLPESSIPTRYTYVNEIPLNEMGKKIRAT